MEKVKTFNDTVDSIEYSLSNYQLNGDFRITKEFIRDKVIDIRAAVVREIKNRNKSVPSEFYQERVLTVTPGTDRKFINENIEATVTLPEIIHSIAPEDIAYFGVQSFKRKFDRHSIEGLLTLEYADFTSQRPAFAVLGNKAYLKNMPTAGMKKVSVIAVWSNPDGDKPFPMPREYKIEVMAKKDILSSFGIRIDETKDELDMTGRGQQAKTEES